MIVFVGLITFVWTGCTNPITSVPTVFPTKTITMEPSITPVATYTILPTETPSPTLIPTPIGLDPLVHEYKTIDPYKFFIERQGHFIYEDILKDPKTDYLREDRGDKIEGNSKEGWYITYKGLVLFLGPGEVKDNLVTLVLGNGTKDNDSNIKIETKKRVTVMVGSIILARPMSVWPQYPSFFYDPISSSFVAEINTTVEQDRGYPPFRPNRVKAILFLFPGDYRILNMTDYNKFKDWCISEKWGHKKEWGLIGYTLNGDFFYWGERPNGEVVCPIVKIENY